MTAIKAGKQWLAAITLVSLTGCLVGPNYKRPPVTTPDAYRGLAPNTAPQTAASFGDEKWWTVFNDPVLNDLVCHAYKQNLTLRQAGYRVLAARAQLGIAVGAIFPQTQTMNGDFLREASSGETGGGPGRDSPAAAQSGRVEFELAGIGRPADKRETARASPPPPCGRASKRRRHGKEAKARMGQVISGTRWRRAGFTRAGIAACKARQCTGLADEFLSRRAVSHFSRVRD